MNTQSDGLQNQIDKYRKDIRSESYPMSIGEFINLYQDREIDLHPEFQRFFRWTHFQKTRLIESILLGIPLPAIFLVQRNDGVLDVVDGLQRLSTIFEFVGILKNNEKDSMIEPLSLLGTRHLPALEGVCWESKSGTAPGLSQSQRLHFKRSKINLIIIERLSDSTAKYELFERLNTGGSTLSNQEIRNCILLMINPEVNSWVMGLASDPSFKSILRLSNRQAEERYDLELVVRFIVMNKIVDNGEYKIEDDNRYKISGLRGDLGEYLTDKIIQVANDSTYDHDATSRQFRSTMEIINQALGDEAFVPYKEDKDTFSGKFSVAAFEAITHGVSSNLSTWKKIPKEDQQRLLKEKVVEMWKDKDRWRKFTGTGINAETRLPFVLSYAPDYYSPNK